MLFINNYNFKNSLIHRCHPVIKFLVFLLIIFLLFLKISVFVHLSLLLITFSIAYLSKSAELIYKKVLTFYVGLFLFLLLINWLLNKNPGFWNEQNIAQNYVDVFSYATQSRGSGSSTAETIKHGRFLGGSVGKTSGSIATSESIVTLKESLKTNATKGNIKIFQVVMGNGLHKYVAFYPKWYTLTELQLLTAFNATNKLICIIILSSLLTITTSMSDLSYALEDAFKPLKLFKLPAKEMALIIAIALRFAPSLLHETFRIIKAQASRGIDFKNGKIKDKSVALVALFVPLFIIAFIKSDELSSAMIARSYKSSTSRTSYRVHNIHFFELVVFSFVVTYITFLYFFHFHCFIWSALGNVEYLLLIAK